MEFEYDNPPRTMVEKYIRRSERKPTDDISELLNSLPDATRIDDTSLRYVITRNEYESPNKQVVTWADIEMCVESETNVNQVKVSIYTYAEFTHERQVSLREHIKGYLRWSGIIPDY